MFSITEYMDLDAAAPAGGLQAPDIGHHGVTQAPAEILGFPGLRPGAIVLEVNDQQRGVGRIDRHFAAQCRHGRRSAA
jgi:hypothetical protein